MKNFFRRRRPPPAEPEGMERRPSQEGERRRSREEDAVEERVIRESSEAEERKREREREEDDLEEFQLQLVLELSARDDPKEMETEVAKQMRLWFCRPTSSPAEVLAARYWNFNTLGYDDIISDGFYDIYITGNGPSSINMPSLSDLRAQPFSHNSVNWEAVLVHRGEDPELMKLEQKALRTALELRQGTSERVGNVLIQELANLVAKHMGGIIFDPENMSVKYQNMIRSLRTHTESVVVPVGQLKNGLTRHRALLFKVLADSLDVPCRLLKGRQYTGSDDGAMNIVKFDDGREFIVDLVTDPGTIIPSDGAVLSTEFEDSSVSDNHQLSKADTTNQLGSSLSGVSNSACDSFEYELLERRSVSSNVGPSDTNGAASQTSNQQNTLSSSFELLSVSTNPSENRPVNECRNTNEVVASKNKEKSTGGNNSMSSSPSSPEVGSGTGFRRMKVKDISETLSEAVKNTEAQLKWSNSRPDMEKIHLAKSNQTVISSESLNARKNQEDKGSGPSSHGEFSDDEEPTVPSESTTVTLLSSLELSSQATELKTLEDVLVDANAKPARLSYPFIKSITRNFSKEIGRGGFGIVYLGHLGTEKVAVKKLDIWKCFSDTIFAEEINCLMRASAKHHNVVRFLGYCADTHGEFVPFNGGYVMSEVPQRLLCFEYVPNGNLEKHLKDKSHKDEWQIRYQMIRGICHGLNSLHGQRINHLDLKPDNILLDASMNPKITDFGISRCFDEGISRVYTEIVRGTRGSIAPEMIDRGEITFKSDIYCLGIIIIKLLTGCNKYDFENWHTSIDMDGPQVKICTEIAQKCLSFDPHERPAIAEIIKKLDETERL